MRKGKYLVITGPSGSGKTTVSGILLERLPSVARLITTTTRDPREGEKDGVDYHFVTREAFRGMIDRGEFLEWADVYGKMYGSTRAEVSRLCALHDVVVGVLDVQGARATKEALPETVTVCLTAPLPQLHARLSRRSNKPGELERRMKEAEHEMSLAPTFDHVIACVDGSLEQAARTVMEIALDR